MPHRTTVEEASRKRGRKISPEIIEELLGFAGPGAIKSIGGIRNIGVRLRGKQLVEKEALTGLKNLVNPDRLSKSDRAAIRSRANIDLPNTISEVGLRKNVGGRRPPDAELEALALKKQKSKLTTAKQLEERNKRIRAIKKAIEEIHKAGEDEGIF